MEVAPMDAEKAAKMAKFNAQFQRSDASPLKEAPAPRQVLDGGAVLDKFVTTGAGPGQMSGAEYYALIGHIKRQHGHKGEALETELMKITRQMDKKIRLLDWVGEHVAKAAPTSAAVAASPAPPQVHPQQVTAYEQPAAGTPSGRGQQGGIMGQQGAMPQISRLNLGNMGGEERVPGEQPQHVANSGAQTARARTAMLGGGGMADLISGSSTPRGNDGSMTARPATAQAGGGGAHLAAAAPTDMAACLESFRMGRDHLKMSGGEYYALVAHLMACGHTDLESDLLKVRSMGDKKLHLVKFIKERCSGGTPVDVSDGGLATSRSMHQEPVVQQMGHAQVMQMAPQQMAPPQMAPQPMQAANAMQAAALQQQSIAAAIATIQQATGGGGLPAGSASAFVGSIQALEATVTRLDESFAFAVECMQTDLAAAKAEIVKLKAMLPV